MDFADQIRQLAKRAETLKPHLQTEEATKHSLVLPFIQLLGYDVFDPHEVIPEFTADVGVKKGEKVDYALVVKGKPEVLVEAKSASDPLEDHDSQLFRYFASTSTKFAILTNGIVYKVFTDLQEANKMDNSPFLELDLMDLRESIIPEIKKFHKENFDKDALFTDAANLKHMSMVRQVLDREMREPGEVFCRLFLKEIMPQRSVTQHLLDRFRPIVTRAISLHINEIVGERLKTAIASTAEPKQAPPESPAEEVEMQLPAERGIVTTTEEWESYFIIKALTRDIVAPKRITLRDNKTYCSILLDDNSWRWICRLYYNSPQRSIALPKADKKEQRIAIGEIDDLYKYGADLCAVVSRYLAPKKVGNS